jgi:hypothetical protein
VPATLYRTRPRTERTRPTAADQPPRGFRKPAEHWRRASGAGVPRFVAFLTGGATRGERRGGPAGVRRRGPPVVIVLVPRVTGRRRDRGGKQGCLFLALCEIRPAHHRGEHPRPPPPSTTSPAPTASAAALHHHNANQSRRHAVDPPPLQPSLAPAAGLRPPEVLPCPAGGAPVPPCPSPTEPPPPPLPALSSKSGSHGARPSSQQPEILKLRRLPPPPRSPATSLAAAPPTYHPFPPPPPPPLLTGATPPPLSGGRR